MLKKTIQISLGILTSIVLNGLFILKYFYFALDVLDGNKNYTIEEFSKLTTYDNMILIPLSYIIILGLVNFLIYKFTIFKYFSIAFFIVGFVMTWFLYLVFPSMIWL